MHSISSIMMLQPHWSCEVILFMWTDWLDLPKLTTLKTINNGSLGSGTFAYVYHIVLESDSHPLWMMLRHAPSQRCGSSKCILLQYWRHNHRKYSHHPSFTTRHRSSSKLLQLITERYVIHPLCATHHPLQSLVECHSGSLGSTDRSEWYSTPWVINTQSGLLICWVYDSMSILDPHIFILHKERFLVV